MFVGTGVEIFSYNNTTCHHCDHCISYAYSYNCGHDFRDYCFNVCTSIWWFI